jgi:hypothetical protein
VLLGAATPALTLAVPAFAFDCSVAKKPPTAGAVGIVDFTTGEFTPLKSNPGTEDKAHGGFVALTDGDITVSTFLHAPDGVLPPVRSGGPQDNCNGKGARLARGVFRRVAPAAAMFIEHAGFDWKKAIF